MHWTTRKILEHHYRTRREKLGTVETFADDLAQLRAWFNPQPGPGALSASEHMLAGCPNELSGLLYQIDCDLNEYRKGKEALPDIARIAQGLSHADPETVTDPLRHAARRVVQAHADFAGIRETDPQLSAAVAALHDAIHHK